MARKRNNNNAAANLKIMENVLQKELNRAERAMQEINDNGGIFSNETNEDEGWIKSIPSESEIEDKENTTNSKELHYYFQEL